MPFIVNSLSHIDRDNYKMANSVQSEYLRGLMTDVRTQIL